VILLDTHVLLWLDRDDARLGANARASIAEAWGDGCVAASAISFWETGVLQQRGRIDLHRPLREWRADWLAAGLQELPLDGATALLGAELTAFHADPADRFITATALRHQARLLTADRAILEWAGTLERSPADR
jgi:PIN domain nuclease of toxin-antitoxin system